jgi:glyoxylase-like metal-dependent hydrolase (beta-lactamase superfamily II)
MFTQIAVPTPFQIGRVNTYVAGRTVVDPGPDSDEAWAALLDGLEELEMAPADVERVLVTHPHPDHFGLASRLTELGADVLASPTAAGIMADFSGRLEREQAFFRPFFERCGLSEETARTVTDLPDAFLAYAPDVEADRELEAGDTVTVDGATLTVDSVAGHAPGEIIFAFETDGERRAVVGDNVLGHITPNPLLQPPPESGGERPHIIPKYNDSLARLREAEYDQFLPGHGDRVDDPPGRIDEILAAHEERTENVLDLVEGPTVPADVMQGLFGDLPVTEQFSGMSEAVGHLDVLEERGQVRQRASGDVIVYERTDD